MVGFYKGCNDLKLHGGTHTKDNLLICNYDKKTVSQLYQTTVIMIFEQSHLNLSMYEKEGRYGENPLNICKKNKKNTLTVK